MEIGIRCNRNSIIIYAGDQEFMIYHNATSVAARKDDAPAAVQEAMASVTDTDSFSGGGGLIQTTSG